MAIRKSWIMLLKSRESNTAMCVHRSFGALCKLHVLQTFQGFNNVRLEIINQPWNRNVGIYLAQLYPACFLRKEHSSLFPSVWLIYFESRFIGFANELIHHLPLSILNTCSPLYSNPKPTPLVKCFRMFSNTCFRETQGYKMVGCFVNVCRNFSRFFPT